MAKAVTCEIGLLHSHIGDKDLHHLEHKGFTVGKGKKIYWYIVWHSTGNATVYSADNTGVGRYVRGEQLITIHFKP